MCISQILLAKSSLRPQCTAHIGERNTSEFQGENQQSHFDGGTQVGHIGKIVLRQHSCAFSPASKIKLFSMIDIHASYHSRSQHSDQQTHQYLWHQDIFAYVGDLYLNARAGRPAS
jgi:hypothetical protein